MTDTPLFFMLTQNTPPEGWVAVNEYPFCAFQVAMGIPASTLYRWVGEGEPPGVDPSLAPNAAQ